MAWEDRSLYDRIIDRWSQLDNSYTKFNASRDWIVTFFRPDLAQETDEGFRGTFLGNNIFDLM